MYLCINPTVVICNICNLYTKTNLYGSFLMEKSTDKRHVKNFTKEMYCFYHILCIVLFNEIKFIEHRY